MDLNFIALGMITALLVWFAYLLGEIRGSQRVYRFYRELYKGE